jgi:3-oxoacyl-[acyl-carrier protein] reductase
MNEYIWPMKLLENKIAIVTGASRGIGEAIAVKLAGHGAHIAFTYLSSEERAKALEDRLKGLGVRAKAYRSHAGVFAESEAFVNDVVKEFGTVDICVNNAGISKDNLLLRLSPEQWDDVINVNLKSVFNVTKQVIRPMMKAKSGSIINMSSIIGIGGICGVKGRDHRVHEIDCQGAGEQEYPLQCDRPGVHRDGYDPLSQGW